MTIREDSTAVVGFGEAVQDCYARSVRRWLKKWRSSRSTETMFSEYLASVEVTALRIDAYSKLTVVVTVRCRRSLPDEAYVFSYRRVQESGWKDVTNHKV